MKKDWKYILYLSIVIGIFALVRLSETKQNSWSVTLAHADKEPYGTYALNQLFPSLFKNASIRNSYKTIYELKDSLKENESLVILATQFGAGKADTDALLDYAGKGGTVFISAHSFSDQFADTLGLGTRDYLFKDGNLFSEEDSALLHFTNSGFDTTKTYSYKRGNIHNYFSKVDSVKASVIAKNDQHLPVTLRVAVGKGQLILNCTPMAFTNIYLLSENNNEFISNTLSYLPQGDVYRTEYYHLGRMEIETPLRFILTTEPLKWAYYITFISILLFMIFEAKRKQRIIPIISPLTNTTLEFVSIIGNLYYQKADHKNIAEKKIHFFFEYIRTNYYLSTSTRTELFIASLAKKSGNSEEKTRFLVNLINHVLSGKKISEETLIDLNERIENFHAKN